MFMNHTAILCYKSLLLLWRHRMLTLVQVVLSPVLSLLILYLIANFVTDLTTDNVHPASVQLGPMPFCSGKPRTNDVCITVMYTPSTPFTYSLMQSFVKVNNL